MVNQTGEARSICIGPKIMTGPVEMVMLVTMLLRLSRRARSDDCCAKENANDHDFYYRLHCALLRRSSPHLHVNALLLRGLPPKSLYRYPVQIQRELAIQVHLLDFEDCAFGIFEPRCFGMPDYWA